MSCKVNTFGQPACFITAHPDYPQEKFCVTCRQRFYHNALPPSYTRYPRESSNGVFFLIIALLMLVILFRAIPNRPASNSNIIPLRRVSRIETLDLTVQKS